MVPSRLLSWLLVVVVVAVCGVVLSALGWTRPLRAGVQLVVEPLATTVSVMTTPVVQWAGSIGSYNTLRDENRDLGLENERLRVEIAQLREEQIRVADVQDLINVQSLRPNDSFVFGAVVGRDPNLGRSVLAINRGRSDGVQVGMPVLGRGGAMVGTVERADDVLSWVRLINDPQSDVGVTIQESRALGVATGQSGGRVEVNFLGAGYDVKPGDTVLTSGNGGLYPAGLLMGRVASVDGAALDIFKRARVDPAVRLANLESVAVLTSFQPLRLSGRN